jgi:hypothetical protein
MHLQVRGALGGILGGEGEGGLEYYIDWDYARCPDDNKSTSGLFVTFRRVVDLRSRKQKSTAQSTTNAEYCAFGVGCMRLTQISHLMNKLGIPTVPHMFSNSQSLIWSIYNRIYRGSLVTHDATKFDVAGDMAREGGIDLRYIPTAEMLPDCFTQPLPNPGF